MVNYRKANPMNIAKNIIRNDNIFKPKKLFVKYIITKNQKKLKSGRILKGFTVKVIDSNYDFFIKRNFLIKEDAVKWGEMMLK